MPDTHALDAARDARDALRPRRHAFGLRVGPPERIRSPPPPSPSFARLRVLASWSGPCLASAGRSRRSAQSSRDDSAACFIALATVSLSDGGGCAVARAPFRGPRALQVSARTGCCPHDLVQMLPYVVTLTRRMLGRGSTSFVEHPRARKAGRERGRAHISRVRGRCGTARRLLRAAAPHDAFASTG